MKIGVALSGCDIGGVGAWGALRELARGGLPIDMISVCGLPAYTSLLYAYGLGPAWYHRLAQPFLDHLRGDAPGPLPQSLLPPEIFSKMKESIPFAVSAADVRDGTVHLYRDTPPPSGGSLTAHPLPQAQEILHLGAGTTPAQPGEQALCDFSVWHGIPAGALRLAGVEKVISIAFLPAEPRTPYQVMVRRRIADTAHLADIHLEVIPPEDSLGCTAYRRLAAGRVAQLLPDILSAVLFPATAD